jgi:hypothetical protein
MSKKWLYSVAVGALLIAGEAMGVTVHDVLSNGFWSAEQRGTEKHLFELTGSEDYNAHGKYSKTKIEEDGTERWHARVVTTGPIVDGVQWKEVFWYNCVEKGTDNLLNTKIKLNAKRNKIYKERTLTNQQRKGRRYEDTYLNVNQVFNSSSTYVVKPQKKDARPMGSFVMDDWFPDEMTISSSYKECRFFGTEHNAVTNVISDNEAYITGTIFQTGRVDKYDGYKVNEDSSLLRTYTQHITTDADHVYVEQEITEDAQNRPLYNSQDTYQTQYTATFKKGQWKGSTETISRGCTYQMADWLKRKLSQNSR